jgi:SM-20-related protein
MVALQPILHERTEGGSPDRGHSEIERAFRRIGPLFARRARQALDEARSFAPAETDAPPGRNDAVCVGGLRLDLVERIETVEAPFRHLKAGNVLDPRAAAAIHRDFPAIRKSGFIPADDLDCGPAFKALLDALAAPAFSRILGDKLGIDLGSRPQMAMVRRWSGPRDGRAHTDGLDKAATALLYLNPDWADGAGALRYLEGPDLDGPGSAPIPPLFGALTCFARSDRSWHGHKPFVGERRVIQLFWMVDGAAMQRKQRRHRRQGFLRFLRPAMGDAS